MTAPRNHAEMVGSASGQDGRTSSSIAATTPRIHAGKRLKSSPSNPVVTLIIASPARFYSVEHPYRHLTERGFPNIFWLRTPSGEELDKFDDDATKRCMMFWYSTVLPSRQALHAEESTSEAFVMEDTFVCRADVIFYRIVEETRNKGFEVVGYG